MCLNICLCASQNRYNIHTPFHMVIHQPVHLSYIYRSMYLSIYLFVHLPIYLHVCLPGYPLFRIIFTSMSIYLSYCLSSRHHSLLSVCLAIRLSAHLSIYVSIYLMYLWNTTVIHLSHPPNCWHISIFVCLFDALLPICGLIHSAGNDPFIHPCNICIYVSFCGIFSYYLPCM